MEIRSNRVNNAVVLNANQQSSPPKNPVEHALPQQHSEKQAINLAHTQDALATKAYTRLKRNAPVPAPPAPVAEKLRALQTLNRQQQAHLDGMPTSRSVAQNTLVTKLAQFWTSPVEYTITRQEIVARDQSRILAQLASLGVADGVLTTEDEARVQTLTTHPNASNRAGKPGMPGVYAISLPGNAGGSAGNASIGFSGAFVITQSSTVDAIDANTNVGTVLLYTPAGGLEKFTSLSALNTALRNRLDDSDQREVLLKNVARQDHDQVTDADNALDETIPFRYTPIDGHVIEERLQSQIDQQKKDVAFVLAENVPGSTATDLTSRLDQAVATLRHQLDVEPMLEARDRRLLDLAIRRAWPDWIKNAGEDDRQLLGQYETDNADSLDTVNRLMADVASPQAYARHRIQTYVQDKLGIAVDPDQITVSTISSMEAGTPAVTQETSLTELVLQGPHAVRTGVTRSIAGDNAQAAPAALTPAFLNQMLGELDVRKDYGGAVEQLYRNPEVSEAMVQLRNNRLRLSAFSTKLQGQFISSGQDYTGQPRRPGYDLVQRVLQPASTPGATNTATLDAVSMPMFGDARLKDLLVFRETNAAGADPSLVLYAPGAPGGQDMFEFSNWTQLNWKIGEWTATAEGRAYLLGQLDPVNRDRAKIFFDTVQQMPTKWTSNTVTRKSLSGENYLARLGDAVAEQQRNRAAEAKMEISPNWYTTATHEERKGLADYNEDAIAADQAFQALTQQESFRDYAHREIKANLKTFLNTQGMTDEVDPDTVLVDLEFYGPNELSTKAGKPKTTKTLTDLAIYGYDSSINLGRAARIRSSIGQNLDKLKPEHLDGRIRGTYYGDKYVQKIKDEFLNTSAPIYAQRRDLKLQHNLHTMQRDALTAKLKGEVSDAQYTWLEREIKGLSTPNGRATQQGFHTFQLNGRVVEGVYVVRNLATSTDLLYTPDAPDGRLFRPYSTLGASLDDKMQNYFYQRVMYRDQPVVGTRLAELAKEQQRPDALTDQTRIHDFRLAYDARIRRTVADVSAMTTSRGEMIAEQVWKGITYIGMAVTLPFPPASAAFGAFLAGKGIYDGVGAYMDGDRAAAGQHFINAALDLAGAGGDLFSGGLKGLGTLVKPKGGHFGSIGEAGKALSEAKAKPATSQPFFRTPQRINGQIGYPLSPITPASFAKLDDIENIAKFRRSEVSLLGLQPETHPLERGVYKLDGRHYIGDGIPPQAYEVVRVRKSWQLHSDGELAGSFVIYQKPVGETPGYWKIDANATLAPKPRSKWDNSASVEFTPNPNAPKLYRNLNTTPLGRFWKADDVIDFKKVEQEIATQLNVNVEGVTVSSVTSNDLAAKTGIPYNSANPKANPSAWTSPEGHIYIAYDHPDYVVNGKLDTDKVRSTVVHEYIHASSHNHVGLQGKPNAGAFENYDENFVDYFAEKIYSTLYPGQPYKTGYFPSDGSIWYGELVRFMEASDTMSATDIQQALFHNPALLKPLSADALKEWKRWADFSS